MPLTPDSVALVSPVLPSEESHKTSAEVVSAEVVIASAEVVIDGRNGQSQPPLFKSQGSGHPLASLLFLASAGAKMTVSACFASAASITSMKKGAG